jgi:nucleotide-binding universal stress UspA family protein
MEWRPLANIVDVAEKGGCDLIVMGSRGIGGIKGRILGGTSRRVVDSCKTPVLVIK